MKTISRKHSRDGAAARAWVQAKALDMLLKMKRKDVQRRKLLQRRTFTHKARSALVPNQPSSQPTEAPAQACEVPRPRHSLLRRGANLSLFLATHIRVPARTHMLAPPHAAASTA